ncbi:MAG: succinate--CoA ligase subunit alpha [Phycisphaerae bacterium]|nr:succinate--CoA ligase subunit alpha [Phycisphaerae bacterium]
MAILIDETKKVMIQGITGREGRARTKLMREFGTNVVGGCTPGKGGQDVEGITVHDTVAEVVEANGGVDVSVVFVPARLVKSAAIEAIEAGVKLVMLVPDRVPLWDAMGIAEVAAANGAEFIGPNTLGVISPGRAVLGMIGGRAESARQWFNEPIAGRTVGVISRSGGMSSSCGYYLSRAGLGISTICHVGGDSVLGLTFPEVALKFQDDPETDAIVLFGEIGGSMEERLADLMSEGRITKPVVAYIGGKAAREGTRFSHAGAIIEGDRGTHAGKVRALTQAGAVVVDGFGDLPEAALGVFENASHS